MNRTGLLRATGSLKAKWLISAGLLVLILFFPIEGVRGSNFAHGWQSNISRIEAHSEYQATYGSLTLATFLFQDPSPDTPVTQAAEPQGDMSPLLVIVVVLVVLGTALLLAISLLRRETDS